MAFHPLGTARAGADPRRAVLDGDLAVHGVAGVHVADGSAVPVVARRQPADHDHGAGHAAGLPPARRAGRPRTSRRPSGSPSRGSASRTSPRSGHARRTRGRTGIAFPPCRSRRPSAPAARIKAYDPAPVEREVLDELFELARWAPNHNLTNPWRFRVLGPRGAGRLKEAAGPEAARPSSTARRRSSSARPCRPARTGAGRGGRSPPPRSPPTSCCSAPTSAGSPGTGARRRCCARPEGRAACGMPDGEHFLGLIHLGRARQDKAPPERAPVDDFAPTSTSDGALLPRAEALAALTEEEFDVVVVGGGITGAGRRARRRHPRLQRRAGREDRLRRGHQQPLLQARARRAALPAELRPRAGARGAARAPADGQARPAPGAAAASSSSRPSTARRPNRLIGPRAEHVRRPEHGQAAPPRPARQGQRRRARRGRGRSGAPSATARSRARRSPSWCPRWPRATRPPATSSTTARPTTRGSC